jgi:hypothetical protein
MKLLTLWQAFRSDPDAEVVFPMLPQLHRGSLEVQSVPPLINPGMRRLRQIEFWLYAKSPVSSLTATLGQAGIRELTGLLTPTKMEIARVPE